MIYLSAINILISILIIVRAYRSKDHVGLWVLSGLFLLWEIAEMINITRHNLLK